MTTAEAARRRRKAAVLSAIFTLLIAIIAFLVYRALTGNSPTPGILAPNLPEYAFSIHGINAPMDVAVSPSGDRIYVTESDGRRVVRVYDRAGRQVHTLRPPRRAGKWHLPVYVAVNPLTGDIYVSDRLRATVYVYDSKGKYQSTFQPRGPLGEGANPLGLAFGPEGNLYMTDVNGHGPRHRVLVFGDDSEPLRKLGSRGQFWFPNGLAVDPRGTVYVSDSNNGRLAIFDSDGKLAASIRRGVGDGDLGLPRGVALDDAGNLFIVDTTAHLVKVYRIGEEATEVPEYIGAFGGEGIEDGKFEYPNGIATDGDGRIYVTDRENDRVQVWGH